MSVLEICHQSVPIPAPYQQRRPDRDRDGDSVFQLAAATMAAMFLPSSGATNSLTTKAGAGTDVFHPMFQHAYVDAVLEAVHSLPFCCVMTYGPCDECDDCDKATKDKDSSDSDNKNNVPGTVSPPSATPDVQPVANAASCAPFVCIAHDDPPQYPELRQQYLASPEIFGKAAWNDPLLFRYGTVQPDGTERQVLYSKPPGAWTHAFGLVHHSRHIMACVVFNAIEGTVLYLDPAGDFATPHALYTVHTLEHLLQAPVTRVAVPMPILASTDDDDLDAAPCTLVCGFLLTALAVASTGSPHAVRHVLATVSRARVSAGANALVTASVLFAMHITGTVPALRF